MQILYIYIYISAGNMLGVMCCSLPCSILSSFPNCLIPFVDLGKKIEPDVDSFLNRIGEEFLSA